MAKHNPLTKIVATVGPASEAPEVIEQLIKAGVTTFRLNFSHGEHAGHEAVYRRIREIAARLERPTTILQDLQGPKLRIGVMANDEPVTIADGATLVICTREVAGTAERVSTSYPDLANDIDVGDQILIDDGLIELRAVETRHGTEFGDEIVTEVVHGGALKSRKGINLPGTNVSSPALTAKDEEDLAFGIRLGVDMVALSFVRRPQDVVRARERIRELGGHQPLIAKIEKPQAVQDLDAIVAEADGFMVARGDLGVELSTEQVPLVQKRLIRLANRAGKPVITATQMLESMIENPRPTRAEASDIANAILDGTDAVMLSGETAIGAYPVLTVETMAQIARTIEADASWRLAMDAIVHETTPGIDAGDAWAVAYAASALATNLGVSTVAVVTGTGGTAKRISQRRPGMPIVAIADNPAVASWLSLWHGVMPVCREVATTTDNLIRQVDEEVLRSGHAAHGDRIIVVGSERRTNGTRAYFIEYHDLT